MTKKTCSECNKEITAGKYYNFMVGEKGNEKAGLAKYQHHRFFCPSCADKEAATDNPFVGYLVKYEWEVGNQTDEEIIKFEEKWEKYNLKMEVIMEDADQKVTLALLEKIKQEFETYQQKLDIVEKSFGGKINGYGKHPITFYYLFAKSAREKSYRQEVVEPTIAKILGWGTPPSINTVTSGCDPNDPSIPGCTGGMLKPDNQLFYLWTDGEWSDKDNCRRIRLSISDLKLAFQSFLRSLDIKIWELEQKNNNGPKGPSSPQPKDPREEDKGKNANSSSSNKSNYVLWISLILGSILLIGLVVIFLRTKRKIKKY